MIVAGVSDCENFEINIIRSKYQGLKLREGYFREEEGLTGCGGFKNDD